MRDYERRKLHRLVRHLKAEVPLTLPVSVRVAKIPKRLKMDGYTTFDGASLSIRIANGRYSTAVDTLVHEWGHALVICAGYEHDAAHFGPEFARAYQAWERFDPKARK